MRRDTLIPCATGLLLALASCVPAETGEAAPEDMPAEEATASGPTAQSELLADLAELSDKYLALAEATPESDYGWRPSEGIRSVSEAYMHVVVGNFGIVSRVLGSSPPEGADPAWYGEDAESITDKATVVEALGASFEYMAEMIESTSDEQMMEALDLFGRSLSVRGGLTFALSHCHEHLGQSIAYARSIGVVPPWSM